jgi:hypothetical protein
MAHKVTLEVKVRLKTTKSNTRSIRLFVKDCCNEQAARKYFGALQIRNAAIPLEANITAKERL